MKDFPNLNVKVNGKKIVYFDNASTTFKPKRVIKAVENHYSKETSNVHRGLHHLSQIASEKYENTRKNFKEFINANSEKEIIFTKGTTNSINLVAYSLDLQKGDVVLISEMEHHSNIVPWQLMEKRKGIVVKKIPIDDNGDIIMEEYENLLEGAKLVGIVHISNSLGTINPIHSMIKLAHDKNVLVLVDSAQAIGHTKIDVQELDADFMAFSGHKMFGPTGVGVLYGKEKLLNEMVPFEGGGDMILSVSFEGTKFNEIPFKFEAGTPNIAGVIGLNEAIEYIKEFGYEKIGEIEKDLLDYCTEELKKVEKVKIIGNAKNKTSIISFVIEGIHPHDISTFLDNEGIAIRAGHHCCQPVMDRYSVSSTARISMCFYNTRKEIDKLIETIIKMIKVFS